MDSGIGGHEDGQQERRGLSEVIKAAKNELVPAIRIDGGKRINLKAHRERRKEAKAKPPRPEPDEEALARDRQEQRKEAKKRAKKEKANMRAMADGAKDGAREFHTKIQVSHERTSRQHMRAMPGTFEWKYARGQRDSDMGPLYDAGSYFARLFERASSFSNATVDWSGGGGAGDWKGLPDGRCSALDAWKNACKEIGLLSSRRLTDYCVEGRTSTEIARKHNIDERDIPAILRQDLRACALHFRLI